MTAPKQTAHKTDKNGQERGKNRRKQTKSKRAKTNERDDKNDKAGAPISEVACLVVYAIIYFAYATIIYV